MRKIVCMLAAIIAISTLTGCPANTTEESSGSGSTPDSSAAEPADTSSGSVVDSGSAGNEAASAGNTAQGESSSAPEIPAADDFIPTINESKIYRSGTWYFTAKDKDGNNKHYLYIADSKELIEFEPESDVVDVSGCLVAYENGTLKNIKTGEVYAGGDTGFRYIVTPGFKAREAYAFANDGTAMIYKFDPGFDSVTVSLGVLNNDGTWRNEIASDNALDTLTDYDLNEWFYVGGGFLFHGVSEGLYCMDTDCLFEIDHYKGNDSAAYYIYSNDTTAYFVDVYQLYSRDFISYGHEFYNLFSFDKESKTITDFDLYNRTLYNISGSCVAVGFADSGSKVRAYNMETGEEMLFDISSFEISVWNYKFISGVLDNALMFKSEGADGNEYTCMINQAGERLIEPKIMEFVCIVGDKFLCTVDGTLTMFDTSGKETKLPGKLAYSSVTAENYGSVIAVETDEGFKLIDLNDPENPFTPFDAN